MDIKKLILKMLKNKGMYKIAICVIFIGGSIVISDGILVSYLSEAEILILLLALALLWWVIRILIKKFKSNKHETKKQKFNP
jgi:uncharacterized membrane protein YfcA